MATQLIYNKKIALNYELLERFEAGIELTGFEVKSIKHRQGSLEGSYVIIRGGEAFLQRAYIPPYQERNTPAGFEPYRLRRLLMTAKEIRNLAQLAGKPGLTIAAVSMYNKGRKIKVEVAVARGKKKFDKRQSIKKQEAQREMERTLKYE